MTISSTRKLFLRHLLPATALLLALMTAGCGTGNNNPTNVGLFGDWNIVMFPTGSSNAMYVFALAISQEGSNTYSGSPIPYTGSVPIPTNLCINSSDLRASATTTGNNFTLTITDATSATVITVQGTLATNTSTLSGTYSNPASQTCGASSGTMSMTPQQ